MALSVRAAGPRSARGCYHGRARRPGRRTSSAPDGFAWRPRSTYASSRVFARPSRAGFVASSTKETRCRIPTRKWLPSWRTPQSRSRRSPSSRSRTRTGSPHPAGRSWRNSGRPRLSRSCSTPLSTTDASRSGPGIPAAQAPRKGPLLDGKTCISGECAVFAANLLLLAQLPKPYGLGMAQAPEYWSFGGKHKSGFVCDHDLTPHRQQAPRQRSQRRPTRTPNRAVPVGEPQGARPHGADLRSFLRHRGAPDRVPGGAISARAR